LPKNIGVPTKIVATKFGVYVTEFVPYVTKRFVTYNKGADIGSYVTESTQTGYQIVKRKEKK
jgi:hypothetical protein